MTQGERVREIRKSLNLTLDKFGERIGIKKSALSSIENDKSNLTDANTKSINTSQSAMKLTLKRMSVFFIFTALSSV